MSWQDVLKRKGKQKRQRKALAEANAQLNTLDDFYAARENARQALYNTTKGQRQKLLRLIEDDLKKKRDGKIITDERLINEKTNPSTTFTEEENFGHRLKFGQHRGLRLPDNLIKLLAKTIYFRDFASFFMNRAYTSKKTNVYGNRKYSYLDRKVMLRDIYQKQFWPAFNEWMKSLTDEQKQKMSEWNKKSAEEERKRYEAEAPEREKKARYEAKKEAKRAKREAQQAKREERKKLREGLKGRKPQGAGGKSKSERSREHGRHSSRQFKKL
tara:strand:- start:516 stop:1328 length:813 start_codon:yes stop_codon:yes gene_type:complete